MIQMNIAKMKQKIPLHQNITYIFELAMIKWLYSGIKSRFVQVQIWIVVTNTGMYWITTQEHGGDTTMRKFRNSEGIRIMSMINYWMELKKPGGK